MVYEILNDYRAEIKELEDQTARNSDQILELQERRFLEAVREMTQSVVTVSRENELLRLSEDAGIAGNQQVVDFAAMAEKIGEFDKLIELLKVTYLEQEALDFFLRYTISSTDVLHLSSLYDEKYVKLEEDVNNLENDGLKTHLEEIEDIELNIKKSGDELAKSQDKVNEILLETADVLDNCDQMMEELDLLRKEHRKKNENLRKNEEDPLVKTYKDWQDLKVVEKEYRTLVDQLHQWEKIKKSYDFIESTKAENSSEIVSDPRLTELGSALESLIRIWESKFLPRNGWQNLEVYPQTKKFQFDALQIFTAVISLDGLSQIKDVTVYNKEKSSIKINRDLGRELSERHLGAKDIFKAMELSLIHI